MPLYVTCPQCNHPAVLPRSMKGRRYRCRQCAAVYEAESAHFNHPQPQQVEREGVNFRKPA